MLAHLYPTPIPFELGEDGRKWFALPLRIRDIAALEAACMAADPLVFTQPAYGDINELAYRQELRESHERIAAAVEGWASPRCNDFVFGSASGRAAYLCCVLRAQGNLEPETLFELATTATNEQWEPLDRFALGVDLLRLMDDRIDREIGVTIYPDKGVSMPVIAYRAMKAYGWTLEQVGDMTLAALRCIVNEGEPFAPIGDEDECRAFHDLVVPRRTAFHNEGRLGHDGIAWNEWEKVVERAKAAEMN